MAIDRQDCVLCPFNRRMTPVNVKFMIAGKWIGALFLTSILFFIVFFLTRQHLALKRSFPSCQT